MDDVQGHQKHHCGGGGSAATAAPACCGVCYDHVNNIPDCFATMELISLVGVGPQRGSGHVGHRQWLTDILVYLGMNIL